MHMETFSFMQSLQAPGPHMIVTEVVMVKETRFMLRSRHISTEHTALGISGAQAVHGVCPQRGGIWVWTGIVTEPETLPARDYGKR